MTGQLSIARGKQRSGLVDLTTDWGVSVSEAKPSKTPAMQALALAGWAGLMLGAFLVIPTIVGAVFFTLSREMLMEFGIVAAVLAAAGALSILSRRGPKNALQVDYDASEVRMGSIASTGAFVRHKVCPLRSIDRVTVDSSQPDHPAIRLQLFGEIATIRFSNTDVEALTQLAARIQTAADEARAAPIRSRIVSRINGFEANAREIGHRVKSRISSTFA